MILSVNPGPAEDGLKSVYGRESPNGSEEEWQRRHAAAPSHHHMLAAAEAEDQVEVDWSVPFQ